MNCTIPLAKPYLPSSALERIAAVLESGHLSEGSQTAHFERLFAEYVGVEHAVAVTSCTSGMELVLRALGITAGAEVIVPGYTYPATAEAVMLTGATAVIVDIDPHTLNVDYSALESAITPRTKALMPVSLFGNPLDWDRLEAVARKHALPVVEDAACGLGSRFGGRRTGAWGTAAVFSLHPRKSLTTGEGGMITTNDAALAHQLRSLKRFGLASTEGQREQMRFMALGGNQKMSDVLAAMGIAQMEEVDSLMARRYELAQRYQEYLAPALKAGWACLPMAPEKGEHAWQSFCLTMPQRDDVLQALRAQGIEAQIGTYSLHREPLFQSHPLARLHGSLENCGKAYERVLALPLFHTMTAVQQRTVADAVLEAAPCA